MIGTSGVEGGTAPCTSRPAIQIFVYRELMAAVAAQDRFFSECADGPDLGFMIGNLRVTLEAREPMFAASEFDGDNVQLTFVMSAACLRINIKTINLSTVNKPHVFSKILLSFVFLSELAAFARKKFHAKHTEWQSL